MIWEWEALVIPHGEPKRRWPEWWSTECLAEAEDRRPRWEARLQIAHSGPLVVARRRERVLGLMWGEGEVPKGRSGGTRMS